MKYKVSYETNQRPEGLPEGAIVEKVSPLPLQLHVAGKTMMITRSAGGLGEATAFVDTASLWGHLTAEQTRDLYEALAEIVGETPVVIPKALPVEFPVVVTSVHGREVTVRRSGVMDGHATVRVLSSDGEVTIGGMNFSRDDAHKLGRALLSI